MISSRPGDPPFDPLWANDLGLLDAIPVRAKKTLAGEKLTFRAGFASVDFRSKIGTEMAGKLQSVRRKNVPISAFEAPSSAIQK